MNHVEEAYKSYSADIYRFAMYKLHDKDEAEDVVSETFARFMEKGDQKEISDLKLWLLGFARNIIYSKYQKEVKMPKVDIADWTESLADEDGQPVELELISEDVVRDVNKELKQLHPAEQEVIILKVWQELTFAQIAELQGQNENTVKAIYYRSLDKMKRKLEKNYKQLNVITLPLLVAAIAKLKLGIAIPATLSNLVNYTNMDSTLPESVTPTQSNAGLKALATTTKGKVLAGVTAAVLITGVAGTGVYLYLNSKDVVTTPVSQVNTVVKTPVVVEEVEPTEVETTVDPRTALRPYRNEHLGISMDVPSSWKIEDTYSPAVPPIQGSGATVRISDANGTEIANINSYIGGFGWCDMYEGTGNPNVKVTFSEEKITIAGKVEVLDNCFYNGDYAESLIIVDNGSINEWEGYYLEVTDAGEAHLEDIKTALRSISY